MKDVKAYTNHYISLSIYERIEQLYADFKQEDIMLTSAFSAYSAILLKVISDINKSQIIYFIDTAYHFEETLAYKEYLTKLYKLNVVSIQAKSEDKIKCVEQELWQYKPDECCHINRVKPLEEVKSQYKLWVSGLMQWQSNYRESLSLFEQKPNILKFHPLLDMSIDASEQFIKEHQLSSHPLKEKGYNSIGCTHCTKAGDKRSGRWEGLEKTECGLHL